MKTVIKVGKNEFPKLSDKRFVCNVGFLCESKAEANKVIKANLDNHLFKGERVFKYQWGYDQATLVRYFYFDTDQEIVTLLNVVKSLILSDDPQKVRTIGDLKKLAEFTLGVN